MNNETYEQFTISADMLGDNTRLLKEGEDFSVQHFANNPIGVQFPPTMIFPVIATVPGVKGDTATGGTKPATLEGGLTLNVPLYVNEGDRLQINTQTLEFQKRVQ